jgi:CHAT domain-containing protein/tetratricopeptide (TPR) repeat protein
MTRRIIAATLVCCSAAFVRADDAEPSRVAEQLREVLSRDDRRTIALLASASTPPSDAWAFVADLVERYNCIEVERVGDVSTTEESGAAIVRFSLIGRGQTIGVPHAIEVLPLHWVVRLARTDRGWTPVSVWPRDRDLARSIIKRPPELRAQAIEEALRSNELDDPGAFGRALVEEASFDEPLLRDVLRFAVARGEADTEVYCLKLLATVHRTDALGEDFAQQALARAVSTRGAEAMTGALFATAVVRWFAGDLAAAIRFFRACGDQHQYLRDPRPALKGLYMGAHLQTLVGDTRGALVDAEHLTKVSALYGWTEGEAMSAFLRGSTFSNFGRADAALVHFRAAYELSNALGLEESAAMALYNVGATESAMGALEDAVVTLRHALRRAENLSTQTAVRNAIGTLLMRSGQLTEAEGHLLEAASVAERADEAASSFEVTVSLGHLRLLQDRPEAALEEARRAFAYAGGFNAYRSYQSSWPAHLLAGRALSRIGCEEDALYELGEAVELIEEERASVAGDISASTEYFSSRTEPYQELAAIHLRAGRPRAAIEIAERMKARGVRDLLERGHIDPESFMTAAERRRYDELAKKEGELGRAALTNRDDAELRKELARARLDLRMYRTSLAIARVELRHRGFGDAPAVPADLPASVDATTFIEFVVGDRTTLAFVISPKGERNEPRAVTGVTIDVGREELARRVASLRKRIESHDLRYGVEARALFQLLLGPFETALSHALLIGFLPDDSLWLLPFHVLIDARGKHLVERAAVFYTPSLATLRERPAAGRGSGTVLALGNPRLDEQTIARAKATFRESAFGSLPEAEVEVNGLRAIYGRERVKVFIGAEARESVFKRAAPAAEVIHIAAHGSVDVRSPLFSAVLLTADDGHDGDDGLLEAREILDLPLRADLAVLAACETASGEIAGGEGMVGLAWAFVAAGSSSVVASQWKTGSDAAATTMLDFHRHLASGMGKAVALRNAQLARMRTMRNAHPFYWAPFVVYGMP